MNIDKGLGNRILMLIYCACTLGIKVLGPPVQNPIGTNPGLTFNKTYMELLSQDLLINRALNNRALQIIYVTDR